MRIHLASGIAILCAAQIVTAQTSAPPDTKATKPAKTTKAAGDKPITLTGCVVRGDSSASPYTLSDESEGE